MQWLGAGGVELAMRDTGTGAHPLHFARLDPRPVTHAVSVCEGAVDDVRQDLHIAVGMHAEAATWLDTILIDDYEIAEAAVARIVVVREGKSVPSVEPPVVGMTPFFAGPLDDHVAFSRFDAALRRSFRQRLVRTSTPWQDARPQVRQHACRAMRWATALLL